MGMYKNWSREGMMELLRKQIISAENFKLWWELWGRKGQSDKKSTEKKLKANISKKERMLQTNHYPAHDYSVTEAHEEPYIGEHERKLDYN